jgi:hypothetical protein
MDLPCDRCLESLAWPVEDTSVLVVQLTENPAESTDEILYLPLGETRLNLAHYFYENIHLHLPLRAVCGESGLPCKAPEGFEALATPEAVVTSAVPTIMLPSPRWLHVPRPVSPICFTVRIGSKGRCITKAKSLLIHRPNPNR